MEGGVITTDPLARLPRHIAWAAPSGPPARADAVPMPGSCGRLRTLLKHPRLMHYNRLIATVIVVNVALAVYGVRAAGWWSADGNALPTIATIAQANLLAATACRQQYVVNAIGWLATRPSPRWPLRLRWMLGKYYHVGGLHVGAAMAGTVWYLVFVASLLVDVARGVDGIAAANVALSLTIVGLLVTMVVLALPPLRARAHDRFEISHRLFAWLVLALVWANSLVFAAARSADGEVLRTLLRSPTFWMLVVTSAFAVWPWLLLRRVRIDVDRPSSHVALVSLRQRAKPPVGTTRAISRNPFVGWHHFANVPARRGDGGYRMLVSRAGDWTAGFVDDPPTHVWVRGLPTVGVANVKRLFTKVVYVVTGSGIGPALGHLLTDEVPSQLVWVTKDPRSTYGDGLIDEVLAAQPNAIIWNTDELGKPNVLRLAYSAYLDSGADAVICISNKTVTWDVVHGFERRGIPAFGPIWDS